MALKWTCGLWGLLPTSCKCRQCHGVVCSWFLWFKIQQLHFFMALCMGYAIGKQKDAELEL